MINKKTKRGFVLVEFHDKNNQVCTIQESSLASENCIWLGLDKVSPCVMRSDAQKLGLPLPDEDTTGWMDYPIPSQVSLNSRMHLNRGQVQDLVLKLQQWLDSGSLEQVQND
jgi:hypothetical protein